LKIQSSFGKVHLKFYRESIFKMPARIQRLRAMLIRVFERVDAEEQCGRMPVNTVISMRAIARMRTNGDEHCGRV